MGSVSWRAHGVRVIASAMLAVKVFVAVLVVALIVSPASAWGVKPRRWVAVPQVPRTNANFSSKLTLVSRPTVSVAEAFGNGKVAVRTDEDAS